MDIKRTITLLIPAGNSRKTPFLGQILGQHGIKLNDFCFKMDALTNKLPFNLLIKVIVILSVNKTFDIIINKPQITYLLKKVKLIDNDIFNKIQTSNQLKQALYQVIMLKASSFNQTISSAHVSNILSTMVNIIKSKQKK